MQNESLSSSTYGNLGAASVNSPETPFTEPSINISDAIHDSRLLMQQRQQHQNMVNPYSLCLTRLSEAAKKAEILRQENTSLQSVMKHVLIKSSINDVNHLQAASSNDIDNSHNNNVSGNAATFENMLSVGMRGLTVGCGGGGGDHREEVLVESPTSLMENVDLKGVSLPKSIAERSDGYLESNSMAHPRTAAQKVYVRGGKREEEPLELELNNQGMFKTELCNKWQETGACPNGDHCQFAHGIEELRPVIRRPRYKTEVCKFTYYRK